MMSLLHSTHRRGVVAFFALLLTAAGVQAAPFSVRATRVGDAPIVAPAMLPGKEGDSINGPSLLRVPDWVPNPLGRYYLYFAHHNGNYIRLAYADRPEGPWKIHEGGVFSLGAQNVIAGHIASPHVVVDEQQKRLYLFYHGNNPRKNEMKLEGDVEGGQLTGVAVSSDGLAFESLNRVVGPAYLQVFAYDGRWFALNHSGVLREAKQIGERFEPVAKVIGPDILEAVDPARRGEPGATPAEQRPPNGPFRYSIRHIGVDVAGDRLVVHFSCVGHRPERILCTVVKLAGDPKDWRARGTYEVLQPERPWEGGDLPLAYSRGGISTTPVRELRDPAVLREDGKAWLVYSIAGEHGLGLAALHYAGND
ncbi:MAG TPA: hypothetical protein VNR00_17640 [Opitutus sp.]|nr:hypothetical protein [Opitutus sp.]